jgi:signal peptidase II
MPSPIRLTASSAPTISSDASPALAHVAVPWSRYLIFLAIAVGGCALDLLTKAWIFQRLSLHLVEGGHYTPPMWLVGNVFGFETNLNEGGLFGFGQGRVMIFAALSIAAALGVLGWVFCARAARDLHLTIALGFVLAGILGNLYDRIGLHGLTWAAGVQGHRGGEPVYAVRDWLHFKIEAIGFDWPIFNLADSCLVCGAILLIWHAFRQHD